MRHSSTVHPKTNQSQKAALPGVHGDPGREDAGEVRNEGSNERRWEGSVWPTVIFDVEMTG